ncbi:MAG: hypothetical protein M3Y27_26505 [Acidobacteriota bacterium]|nr:hypothetical protein [Acidobacteriota bacterium]
MRFFLCLFGCFALAQLSTGAAATSPAIARVTLLRVPDGGLQPQIATDSNGNVHLIYYTGDPTGGDISYVHSMDGGATFSKPLRVNSHGASAIAAGNIRGAHIALGKNGLVHVAWMGSKLAEPKGPGGQATMLYTHLNASGTAFEPERNMIQFAYGLDGGGTVAADPAGNVYVIWHAPEPGKEEEANRRVWVARSSDNGNSFAREKAAWNEPTGACGCCGMGALADADGTLYIQYRSAAQVMNRDTYLLTSKDHAQTFSGAKLDNWSVGKCVMSTQALLPGPNTAWETKGQIFFAGPSGKRGAAPGNSELRKHPALAANAHGDILLAWTEGMAWKKPGTLAWQLYDRNGNPKSPAGPATGVPALSVPAFSLVGAFARPDGGFTIVY